MQLNRRVHTNGCGRVSAHVCVGVRCNTCEFNMTGIVGPTFNSELMFSGPSIAPLLMS